MQFDVGYNKMLIDFKTWRANQLVVKEGLKGISEPFI